MEPDHEQPRDDTMQDPQNAQMLKELHDFFMRPPHEGQPSRATQIDTLLVGVNTGRVIFKSMIFLTGVLIVVAQAWEHVRVFLHR